MHEALIHGIEAAGFHYKPPESPDIWTHLESHFTGLPHIGPKFGSLSCSCMEAMIARGEEALLTAMAGNLHRTGKLGRVTEVIEMPYVVGTSGVLPPDAPEARQALHLVDYPGTAREHIIRVLPVEADAIPCTRRMTATGGPYADGHTAGYYDLCPGTPVNSGSCVWLATAEDIRSLAQDMETMLEDIAIVTRRACEDMLARVKRLPG